MTQPQLIRERLWTKDYILLTVSNFLMFVSLQMLIPTLPVYVQEMGANHLIVGLTVSLFAAAALVARPFSGILLDTIGRKVVVLAGLVSLVFFSVQYFWITSVFLILALRILHGISWGISTTGMGTAAADIVPASRRGEGLGYFGLSVTVSLAVAPYFGLWVMEEFGFTWMFIISCASAALSLTLVRFVRFPAKSVRRERQPVWTRKFWSQMFEKRALMPALLAFLFMSAYSAVEIFIKMFTDEKNLPTAGPFFVVLAAAMFIVRPIGGRLYDRFGAGWIMTTGVLITISGIMLLSFADSMFLLLLSGGICGAGLSAVMPSLQAWTVDRAPSDRIGAANGTYLSGIDLGFSFGSTVNAVIAGMTSYATMYQLINGYLILFLIVFAVYTARLRHGAKERSFDV